MNYRLETLPRREQLARHCTFQLPTGAVLVEINHLLPVHSLVIFFGHTDGRTVHGYCDYDHNCGGITFDE